MKILSSTPFLMIMSFVMSCTPKLTEYENIISKIKENNIENGTLKKYKIDNLADNATMKEVPDDYSSERGKGVGDIWVYKSVDNLVIFIENKDLGHAGQYGLAYSEAGTTPEWNHDHWGEFWSVDEKINAHWWKISYHSD